MGKVKVKVTSEGQISVEVIKIYVHSKYHVYIEYHHQIQT